MRITYVGHATLLIQLGGVTVLTDPNFDDALGRFAIGWRLRRVAPPGIALADLPRLDGVLVTHPHVEADSGPVVLEGYGVDAIRQDRHGVFEQRPVLIQIEYSRLFVQLERAP